MKFIYFAIPTVAAIAFGIYYNWQLAPNPWMVDDRTANKPGECSTHHIAMEKKKVPILYGDGVSRHWDIAHMRAKNDRPEFLEAEKREFPHSRTEAYGGCVLSNKAPASAIIYVCPRCVEALAEWQNHR